MERAGIARPHFGLAGSQTSIAAGTVYGATVAIASYFSGTLSSTWEPRRVLWLDAAWWIVFELLFLVAILARIASLITGAHGPRGAACPLFAFGFSAWIETIREEIRGSAAGWSWFAFTGGLPTSGSAIAAVSLDIIGFVNTLLPPRHGCARSPRVRRVRRKG